MIKLHPCRSGKALDVKDDDCILLECKGAGQLGDRRALKHFILSHKPDLIGLAEPMCSSNNEKFRSDLNLHMLGVNYRSNLWILCSSYSNAKVIHSSDQYIVVEIMIKRVLHYFDFVFSLRGRDLRGVSPDKVGVEQEKLVACMEAEGGGRGVNGVEDPGCGEVGVELGRSRGIDRVEDPRFAKVRAELGGGRGVDGVEDPRCAEVGAELGGGRCVDGVLRGVEHGGGYVDG
ncbi:hypothetical protein Fmac_015389 [Flemingia macrophylla]|uniref:Uncharacterized protein n=1 Tax=Flemingia macrophylla TaxID=520843 RepID=A0ABD1MEG5_9FABA